VTNKYASLGGKWLRVCDKQLIVVLCWRWVKVKVLCHSLAVWHHALRHGRLIWCMCGTCFSSTTRPRSASYASY